jgi:hypothetical protein
VRSSRRAAATILVAAVLIVATAAVAADGSLKGKVSFRDKPLAGVVLQLWSDWRSGFRGAPAATAPTAADGSFAITAPEGRYFVLLRSAGSALDAVPAAGEHYAFYGGNPVALTAGEALSIGINASTVLSPEQASIPGGTGIRGRVFVDGTPLDRARVTVYQDGETIFRGMGYASTLTTADGSFSFSIEPGSYWVVARKRTGDDKMGPLGAGDLFAFAPGNPVAVKDGAFSALALNAAAKQVKKVKDGGQEVTLDGTVKAGGTIVSGVVRDAAGKPIKGLYVGAYRDSMMIYKPDFISNLTGEDGAYTLTLAGGGEFFIIARNTLGGPAEKGDLLGRYAGNESHSVVVKPGEKLVGIDIVAEKVE